jgi:SAM-dependent methyltransferase
VPADLSRYYGDAYYGDGRHSFTARFRAAQRARMLERHAGRRGAVVDVGCGTGDFLRAAAERGWRVFGTELGDAHARVEDSIEVRVSLGELGDLAPFDTITFWHSLEHVRDPATEIRRAHGLLGEEGRLIVAVPDTGGLQARVFGPSFFHLDVPRHLYHFDRRSLSRLLEREGFVVEHLAHQELEYDLFGWLQSPLNRMVAPPNALFGWLMGRPVHARPMPLVVSLLLGGLLFLPALGATFLGSAAGRGATLIMVARKRGAVRLEDHLASHATKDEVAPVAT